MNRVVWMKAKYGMILRTPYSKGFHAALREEIPDSERTWDRASKEWWISDAYIQEAKNLAFQHFTI